MADVELVLKEINKLQLHNIDNEWVNSVIDGEYQEIPPLAPIYSETLLALGKDLLKILRRILGKLEYILSEHDENDSITWPAFINRNIRKNELLTVLFYLLKRAHDNVDADVEMDQMEFVVGGILAARIYLRLLAVPGSSVYGIYHVQFYLMCLKCFHCKRKLSSRDHSQELRSLLVELNHFIVDLKFIIRKAPFDFKSKNGECLTDTIISLVDLIEFARTDIGSISLLEQREERRLCENIHDCLNALVALCNLDDREHRSLVLNKTFYGGFFPKLLVLTNQTNKLNKMLSSEFISLAIILYRENKSVSWTPYQIFIQNLCYHRDGLDRVQVRENRSSIVLELMSHLSARKFEIIFNWIKEMLQSDELASHRNLALEIFSSIIDRSLNWTRSSHGYTEWIFKNNEESSLPSPDDDSDDENNGVPRPGFLMVHNNNTDRVIYLDISELLNLIAERATDMNGFVRTKALSYLMKLLKTTDETIAESLKNLKGRQNYYFLLELATKKLTDEKSSVRRIAVLLLATLFQKDSTLITEDNLSGIVKACFDIRLIVRLAAVQELANLIRKQPDALTINAFLDGLIKRDSDPELRVITTIQEFIQQLIIRKFTMFSEDTQPGLLPWLFLTMVIKRDLKSQLCAILNSMTSIINPELVNILISHIGKEPDNDENCWLMLSCISRFVPVCDVGFAVKYYYEIASNPVKSVSVKEMVLDTLVNCCSVISETDRRELRFYLLDELRTMTNQGVEIGDASGALRRIMIMLAKQLNPDSLQWASHFSEICHIHINDGQNLERWLIATDLALVAPEPSEPILLNALIKMVKDCSQGAYYEGSAERRRSREWRSAAACAGLARAALRSRPCAEHAAYALARLLDRGRQVPANTRATALLALADLSLRSSSGEALLIRSVSECLQDERLVLRGCACEAEAGTGAGATSVRGLAARSITARLLSGHLKLDNRLYHQYFALLADDDPEVRNPIEHYLRGSVDSTLVINQLLDSIMVYNNCKIDSLSYDERDNSTFLSLEGEEKREARMRVYGAMADKLNYAECLRLQIRLSTSLQYRLAEAGRRALAPPMAAVLRDALAVLRLPIMFPPKKSDETDRLDIADPSARNMANVSQELRNKTVGEVIPILIMLHQKLVRISSPLCEDVLAYINELKQELKRECPQNQWDDDDA